MYLYLASVFKIILLEQIRELIEQRGNNPAKRVQQISTVYLGAYPGYFGVVFFEVLFNMLLSSPKNQT